MIRKRLAWERLDGQRSGADLKTTTIFTICDCQRRRWVVQHAKKLAIAFHMVIRTIERHSRHHTEGSKQEYK